MPANPADAITPTEAPGPAATLACRTVLVPLDGSPLSERALGPAGWLADRTGAELHVVAAGVGRDELWWYQRYVEKVAAEHPGTTAHRSDDPDVARGVREMAEAVGPAVVCAATHGRGRAAAVTGSTFLAFLRASPDPVLAVGPQASVPARAGAPLVVCLDGSPASETILRTAGGWARRLGLHLTVLTVASAGVHPIGPDVATGRTAFGPTDPAAYTEDVLRHPDLAGLSVDTDVLWDPTSAQNAILDRLARRPATLVAVASHARTGLARLVLGSVAGAIVHGSPVPVLVQPVLTAHGWRHGPAT
jgi:nucleotide-binding universal stress UspA family protein